MNTSVASNFDESRNKIISKGCSVNTVYFTSECNFACEYCYEHLGDKQKYYITESELTKIADTVIEREPQDQQTLFVMFGGEVTLAWDKAKFFMEYALSKKENVHFNFSTNGYKFQSEHLIQDYKSTKAYRLGKTSLDISFDGIGNYRRVLKNGKPTLDATIKVFKLLKKYNVDYRIRYTVHNGNKNHYYDDILNVSNVFKPTRIIVSFNYSELSENEIKNIEINKQNIIIAFRSGSLVCPICEFCCQYCNGCGSSKEFRSYFTNDNNLKFDRNENTGKFDHFKTKMQE